MKIIFFGSKAYHEIISRLNAIDKAIEVRRNSQSDCKNRWLTMKQLINVIPVGERTVRRLTKAGIVPCKRIGRKVLFDYYAVLKVLENNDNIALDK
ncbi:MAG TPA: helix-turn-helix domain-containing protein [Alistipes finegoldii]|uniref:helix-turn-helix domain-containing protein n=1 Tax=Alistipes finegoldii TaxID=214856 RepID=UPI001D4BD20D|nr:helix-turn-helix domain-containing protein [Alistipes finegoldii]HJG72139.1 helix-turn-helix domain-containing protein [Alistipes finegoldii]